MRIGTVPKKMAGVRSAATAELATGPYPTFTSSNHKLIVETRHHSGRRESYYDEHDDHYESSSRYRDRSRHREDDRYHSRRDRRDRDYYDERDRDDNRERRDRGDRSPRRSRSPRRRGAGRPRTRCVILSSMFSMTPANN